MGLRLLGNFIVALGFYFHGCEVVLEALVDEAVAAADALE